jgi:hypothetical protein
MLTWKRSEHPGELYAAISTAMRPTAAAAASRDTHMRAVEQGEAHTTRAQATVAVHVQPNLTYLRGD